MNEQQRKLVVQIDDQEVQRTLGAGSFTRNEALSNSAEDLSNFNSTNIPVTESQLLESRVENEKFNENMSKNPREKIEEILKTSKGSIIQTIIRDYVALYRNMDIILEGVLDIMPIRRGELNEKEVAISQMVDHVDFLTCKFVVLVPLMEDVQRQSKMIDQFSEIATISDGYLDYARELFSMFIAFMTFSGLFSFELLALKEVEHVTKRPPAERLSEEESGAACNRRGNPHFDQPAEHRPAALAHADAAHRKGGRAPLARVDVDGAGRRVAPGNLRQVLQKAARAHVGPN